MGWVRQNKRGIIHKRNYSQPSQTITKCLFFILGLQLLLEVTVVHFSSDTLTQTFKLIKLNKHFPKIVPSEAQKETIFPFEDTQPKLELHTFCLNNLLFKFLSTISTTHFVSPTFNFSVPLLVLGVNLRGSMEEQTLNIAEKDPQHWRAQIRASV